VFFKSLLRCFLIVTVKYSQGENLRSILQYLATNFALDIFERIIYNFIYAL